MLFFTRCPSFESEREVPARLLAHGWLLPTRKSPKDAIITCAGFSARPSTKLPSQPRRRHYSTIPAARDRSAPPITPASTINSPSQTAKQATLLLPHPSLPFRPPASSTRPKAAPRIRNPATKDLCDRPTTRARQDSICPSPPGGRLSCSVFFGCREHTLIFRMGGCSASCERGLSVIDQQPLFRDCGWIGRSIERSALARGDIGAEGLCATWKRTRELDFGG